MLSPKGNRILSFTIISNSVTLGCRCVFTLELGLKITPFYVIVKEDEINKIYTDFVVLLYHRRESDRFLLFTLSTL